MGLTYNGEGMTMVYIKDEMWIILRKCDTPDRISMISLTWQL